MPAAGWTLSCPLLSITACPVQPLGTNVQPLGTNVQQVCARPITSSSSPGKQRMAIPAPQEPNQNNVMRGADLLVRGLWLSSFCFLEMIWKTQGEEILQ